MSKVIALLMWALVLLTHTEEQKAGLELKVEAASRTDNWKRN